MPRACIAMLRSLATALALATFGMAAGNAPAASSGYTAPGRLIGVGSHRLHLYCVGEGSPAVVLESGLGGTSLDWARVQPGVARFTRVCSYDRAGYGWSQPGPGPRTGRRIAEELATLLVYASVPGPYVLVGHSFGGLTMRLFASAHPDRVAGMVLVDSTHEAQFQRFEEAGIGRRLAPRGGRFYISNYYQIPAGLPDAVRPMAQALAVTPDAVGALYGELGSMRRSADELRAAGNLPEVPLVVLARDLPGGPVSGREARAGAVWRELQRDLATRTGHGVLVVARESGHYIHLDKPAMVVDAIRTVFEASRPGTRGP